VAIHVQAINKLSPADYRMIEEEHARLRRFLKDLQDTCCNLGNALDCGRCPGEKNASCRGHLPSFFYDLLDLAGKHFFHEESIMLGRPHVTEDYEYFRRHQQAHLSVMQELNAIVEQCNSLNKQGETAESYRQLYNRLSQLFEEHDRSFDDPFIQSTLA
jgi:hemerythrin